MTDIIKHTIDFTLSLFRVKIEEVSNVASKKSLEQAAESFLRFLSATPVPISEFNEALIGEWVSWLFHSGYTYKTVVYYVNRLSSLYGKVAKDTGVKAHNGFPAVKEKLKEASPGSLEINSIPDIFCKLRRLVLTDYANDSIRRLAKDIVLFSLYTGGLPFHKLAHYKKYDYQGNDNAVLAIVEKYSKPKNKYLFPLNQSGHTEGQLNSIISSLFSDALNSVGINLSSYDSILTSDLWAVVAMHCGISAADIAGCMGAANRINPIYSFAVSSELSDEQKNDIRNRVNRILSKDPEDWYAMQFRPRVDYDIIQDRLRTVGLSLAKSFYPMEEIIRRVGKKLKRESRPIIPGLLFFRSKATYLPNLFFHIGDLAWGYRYDRNRRSPYAVIPQKAIEDYQKAVGKFVDDMDAHPEGVFRLEEGDKVEITGGEFSGQPAIFEKEIREIFKDGHTVTRITNRLKLAGMQNCLWVVDLDPRRMTKISDKRFEDLRTNLRNAHGE